MVISDVWRTLYTNNFNTDKYLYHYTNFESALKILDTNKLLFSKINNTNDPSESKVKIVFEPDTPDYNKCIENITLITNYFSDCNRLVQLLCFSMDTKFKNETCSEIISKMNPKELYYNISGRGFALPRMWAQYGENNHGVCFIINKEKFSKLVDEYTTLHEAKPVEYKNFYDCYLMTDRKINKLIKKISNVSNGEFAYIEMLKAHDDFINYNFFEKNQNWQNENEYRVLAFVADKASNERLAIPEILTCLEGIVLGEKTDETNEKIIKLFVNSLGLEIDVKRITFNNRLYMLI